MHKRLRMFGAVAIAATSAGVGTSVAAAGGAGAAPAPIVVGGVYDAALNAGANVGAQAAFKAFNDSGGLAGRKIKYVGTENDSSVPTNDLTAAKNLVSQGVMAIVPVVTFGWVSGSVAAAAHIPYFGYSVTAEWFKSDNGFSYIGTNSATGSTKIFNQAVLECEVVPNGCKGKTVAILTLNASSSIQAAQQFAHDFQQQGAKVVSLTNNVPLPPAVVTDYSPFANALLSSNGGKAPDIIQTEETTQDDQGLWTQLKALGFKGTFLNFELYNASTTAAAKGAYTALAGNFLYFSNSPQATAMRTAISKFDPSFNQKTAAWTSVENGYLSAEMFIAAIEKVGPSVTGPKLIAELNKGWTWPGIPNLAGSVTFPDAHLNGAGCGLMVTSDGTAFRTVTQPLCNQLIPNPLYKPGSS